MKNQNALLPSLCFYKFLDFDTIAAVVFPVRSLWIALVCRYGICVENHGGATRECFIWTRFGDLKSGDKGSGVLLLKDHLISETCPLEENASPHLVSVGGTR